MSAPPARPYAPAALRTPWHVRALDTLSHGPRVSTLTKGVVARALRACPAGRAVNAALLLSKHFSPHGPGHGTTEFLRRQRLLALCGWGVQQLRARGAAAPGSGPDPGPSPASTTPAADAALVCALCGAKAGMWQFVPRVAAACSSLSGAGFVGFSGVGFGQQVAVGDVRRAARDSLSGAGSLQPLVPRTALCMRQAVLRVATACIPCSRTFGQGLMSG